MLSPCCTGLVIAPVLPRQREGKTPQFPDKHLPASSECHRSGCQTVKAAPAKVYAFLKRALRRGQYKHLAGISNIRQGEKGKKKNKTTKRAKPPAAPSDSQRKQMERDGTCCNSICCTTWSCCCRLHPSRARLLPFQHPSPTAGCPRKANTCPRMRIRTGPHGRLPPALHRGATAPRGLCGEPQVHGANHCPHRGGTRGAPGGSAHGQDAPSCPVGTKALR